jgi:hypothetical protein
MVNLSWRVKMDTLQTVEVLTRKEAASLIRVCLTSLDKMHLPVIRIGRRVFYRKSTLEAWLSDNEQPNNAHAGRIV